MPVHSDAALAQCAGTLFQLTMNWRAADGSDATLADARAGLAATILATEGRGFPPPAPDTLTAKPNLKSTWEACVAATRVAEAKLAASSSVPANVVFWTADPADSSRVGNADGLGLKWPFLPATKLLRVSGPLDDGTNGPKRLFFFDAIDPDALSVDRDAGPGFWPRQSATTQAASSPSAPTKRRPWIATLLFAAWALIGCYTAVWAWFTAEYVKNEGPNQPWLKYLFTPTVVDDKHFTLLVPYTVVMASMILLALAAGMATRGLWFGAFIDERNRLSLSHVQQWAWSVMLLGSLAWAGWFNATFGAKVPVGAATTTFDTVKDLFPAMDPSLWAALGINIAVTPFLSNTILATKQDAATAPTVLTPTVVTPAILDRNASGREASWVDLITGETAGTEGVVDISRLQHLVISGILLTAYMIELAKKFSTVTSADLPFARLPDVGNTFLFLLAFSHAGYLLFKARAPEAGAAPPGTSAGV